ncbi:MAG: hypothetical protein DWP92_10870 [Armatimonadetes bacterium]|nr:MAG: hypothetical protein DWP92_10870 [Armatimonadota bacterium]
MDDIGDLAAQLADVQRQLLDLPDDAFAERFELKKRQDALRLQARAHAQDLDKQRSTEDLLAELSGLRSQMLHIEGHRIDLVRQAGSGGAVSSEMGNLGGVQINKGIDDAMGLPKIKARLGLIKGILIDRGVEIPPAD